MRSLRCSACFIFSGFCCAGQPGLIKGPYIQVATPNSVVIRWETDVASNGIVKYGTSSLALDKTAPSGDSSTTHIIKLAGLSPFTKYFYSIGTGDEIIQEGPENYFVTAPEKDAVGKYRFWVTGDCGSGTSNQQAVRDRYLSWSAGTITHGWLLLGDNAYNSGTHAEYNSKFFAAYNDNILKRTVLWPAPGNHDYDNGASTATTVSYFSIFSMPTTGEAGGKSSGTPSYYSFDYGNVHFISLDSYGMVNGKKMYDTTGAQASWLKEDLAANKSMWTIAYWHHPPYSMGSHNSDTESDLRVIRSRFIRILERYGVDLILCGHSHVYERSRLMFGYYGDEASFDANVHNVISNSGVYDGGGGSCAIIRPGQKGTVYAVSGSAGQVGGKQAGYPHDAMFYSNVDVGGSLVLDIEANRIDVRWLCADGQIRDKFTMFKNVNEVRRVYGEVSKPVTLTASWPGTYNWNNGQKSRSIVVTPSANAVYRVEDDHACVTDSFYIDVELSTEVKFYPNPLDDRLTVEYDGPDGAELTIYSTSGKLVHQERINRGVNEIREVLPAASYHARLQRPDGSVVRRKLLVQRRK